MAKTTRGRLGMALAAVTLTAACVGTAGITAAGASSTASSRAAQATHQAPKVSPVGAKNFYINEGGGFIQQGQLTINADGTWSLTAFCDTGTWATYGTTIALSDTECGDGTPFTLMGTLSSHGISKKKKPGTASAGTTEYYTFYTLG